MKWNARLRFKACGYRLVRQELDSAGNAVGEPVATPYCPDGGLTLMYLRDDEGREFQIGTDAIDFCAKLPPNTGSGLSIGRLGDYFNETKGRTFEFHEDMLSSMQWESEPFEIDGNFRPCDIYIYYWTVPDADGGVRRFIAVDKIEYRHEPLKMNIISHGYKTIADKVWHRRISRRTLARIFGIIQPQKKQHEHEMQILRQHGLRLGLLPFAHWQA